MVVTTILCLFLAMSLPQNQTLRLVATVIVATNVLGAIAAFFVTHVGRTMFLAMVDIEIKTRPKSLKSSRGSDACQRVSVHRPAVVAAQALCQ